MDLDPAFFRARDRGNMYRAPVAKQNHIGEALRLKFRVEPNWKRLCRSAITPRFARTQLRQPVSSVAAIEIDLENLMARGDQTVGEPRKKWTAHTLQEEKSLGHSGVG